MNGPRRLTPKETGGTGPDGQHLLPRAQSLTRLPSAHSMQSGQLPSQPPSSGTCLLATQPPLASTSAGSDLWSLRGGWESQEGNTVMIGDGGGVL